MGRRYRIGCIGFGRMGRGFVTELLKSEVWEVAYICDVNPAARELAAKVCPTAQIVSDPSVIYADKKVEVVGLYTLADARPAQIRAALKAGKHVIAEKPIAQDIKTEWELVNEIEKSGLLVAVNLFNRNAWYHKEIQNFVAEGEIGKLGIIRVCHMTPGHMPGEGHEPEGPCFHDCGMHYVDVARWYAKSEYKTFHAQGIRMWAHKDPWWCQVHGTFENGVVFDVTQGFVYGHLAREKTHNCYVDVIGTQGIARMRHNFREATIECHGVNQTVRKTGPFDDKKLDIMIDVFARSLIAGKNLGFPCARDSAIASDYAWKMLQNAVANDPPVVGTQEEMQAILEHRRTLRDGYGLPARPDQMPKKLTPEMASCGQLACGEDLCDTAGEKSKKNVV